MRRAILLLILFCWASSGLAKTDIRIDPDYDPRVNLRTVVLPAQKTRSLRRVDARTISALFATELLAFYEVLDLLRFEEALQEKRFTLDDAFSEKARQVVRDYAGVDAIASVEIYRWEEGSAGLPFLTAKKGVIGARLRLMDPYTGRLYWSVNRLDKVSPGTHFLDRATDLFRDVINELDNEFEDRIEMLDEADALALYQVGRSQDGRQADKDFPTERAFVPRMTPEAALLAAYRGYGYQVPDEKGSWTGPFHGDENYEDVEREGEKLLPTMMPKETWELLRGRMPGDDELGANSLRGNDVHKQAPTLPGYDYLDAPTDSTARNSSGYERSK